MVMDCRRRPPESPDEGTAVVRRRRAFLSASQSEHRASLALCSDACPVLGFGAVAPRDLSSGRACVGLHVGSESFVMQMYELLTQRAGIGIGSSLVQTTDATESMHPHDSPHMLSC
eukprot:7377071-Prymnesium_polylepis.1